MDLGLQGRTALVLASGGGLGRAVAKALAEEGVRIALADIDSTAVEGSAREIESLGGAVLPLIWNIADLTAIQPRIQDIHARFGPVEILVNISGGPPPTPVAAQDPTVWVKHFQGMVLSIIAITDYVLPAMKARGWGRIITSTSSGVIAPIPNLGISNTLRISLVAWSKTLAREVARDGITANVIVPGRIATDRVRFLDEAAAKRKGVSVDTVEEESIASIPVGRYGKPTEYAKVVAFLASSCAAYITGSVIRVDGGLIASI
jgi:3-oxoacyl-[acyl-carrier protein] reductase